MDPTAFITLAIACAPQVSPTTASALVATESAFNPWAIGVVGGALLRQPRGRAEALSTARALRAGGWNFSVGLGQINSGNFSRLGLSLDEAFEPCTNLRAMQTILADCQVRASVRASPGLAEQTVLRMALSCYYSGDFSTGFSHGYVRKVAAAAAASHHNRPSPTAQPQELP